MKNIERELTSYYYLCDRNRIIYCVEIIYKDFMIKEIEKRKINLSKSKKYELYIGIEKSITIENGRRNLDKDIEYKRIYEI